MSRSGSSYLREPELSEFVHIRANSKEVLVRSEYERFQTAFLEADASTTEWAEGGRAPHPLVTLPTGERVLVRRYWRGGWVRHFNRGTYFLGNRAFAELVATERARIRGVSVPTTVAAAEEHHAFGYSAMLATLWIPGATAAIGWLAGSRPERAAIISRIGDQIGRLHRAGIGHPDLNLRNLLVRPSGEVVVLDLDRARLFEREAPPSVRARNLLRLERSAIKLGAALSPHDWAVMARGYGPDWPLRKPLG